VSVRKETGREFNRKKRTAREYFSRLAFSEI
jgi:hypothetical protein